jgi:hypothetical protein
MSSSIFTPEPQCSSCGELYPAARADLGYKVCLDCGDKKAVDVRKSWCVIQEYGKGNYQLVTPQTALQSLKQTNQKNVRG